MRSNNQPVRVALIGCGRIAGHHSRSIATVPGTKLIAVCDLVEEKGQAYSREFSVPYFKNYHEMLETMPEINTVAVITPSGMHSEHSMEMLKTYRKNLIVEKPTFMKPSQLDEAYATAESLGLKIFPVFQNRHNKAVVRVLDGLRGGELGAIRVCSVRVRWCRPQRYYDLAPWRGTYAQDGGALTNQGVHHVDLMRLFAGEALRVNARMKTLGAMIEVEDTAIGTVEFAGGALGTLEVTTSARPIDYEASISLVCEQGVAQIGGIAVNELQIYTPDPSACPRSSEDFAGNVYGYGHQALYREIVAEFTEGRPFSVSREDCRNTIQLLNAFYRSDERGNWVDPAEPGESVRLGRSDETIAGLYRSQRGTR